MDITKYKEGTNLNNNEHNKRSGLLNIGATCYINTLIQCLLSCPVFRNFILSKDYFNRINNDTDLYLIKELYSIFESMWVDGNSLNPKRFLNTLRVKFDYIEVNQQNDVHEIFLLIINKLNEEIKIDYNSINLDMNFHNNSENGIEKLDNVCKEKWFELFKNEYSELSEIMYNHSISQIMCGSCEYIHHNHEISCIMDIELSKLGNKTPLKTCIQKHIEKIYLNSNDDNKWKCDKCNIYIKSEKVIKYWNLPEVLVICLKRFGYDKKTNLMKKINTLIDIPTDNLELSDFVISKNKYKYKLNAVTCHIGNIHSGHYYAIINSNKSLNNPSKCHLIDDTSIKTISDKTFESHLNNAYLLFFSKI